MKTCRLLFVFIAVLSFIPRWACAGTLDGAPFRIVVPNTDWQIDDSTARPMGKDVFLMAILTNTNTLLRSVIIKTVLAKETDSSLDELSAGMRDAFANPTVKVISESDVIFLSHHAKTFTYLITQGSHTIYNQAILFVADGNGWTIACAGRPEQKDEIKKIIAFYHKKAA